MEKSNDKLSKIFFFVIPWTVPVIVTFVTYLFYPIAKETNLIWLPLLFIYWGTILTYTFIYRKLRGGVFNKERFKPTLKLKGKYLWLQYLLVYGPLIYTIPLFIINYVMNPNISVAMWTAFILAAAMNGPTEEIYWRACMEDVGKNAGISEKWRLIYTPIAFALWHTAFVIHLFPGLFSPEWWMFYATIILMTWSSGIIWHWVLHRSERLVPQIIYHACANLMSIFPMMMVTVLQMYF